MFGLVAWGGSQTAGQENAINSIPDPDITTQNNNFIFTGPYQLLSDLAVGASVEYGRYSVAQWNGWGKPNIFAVNRNANPTAPIWWHDYMMQRLSLPQNQQIQPYLTNNLSTGTENETLLWRIATPDWSRNVPALQTVPTGGSQVFIARATCTVTPAVNSWVMNNAITFDQTPLGGVYAVLGAQCVGANGIAFRVAFPRTRMYLGRRLRPGGIVLPTFGSLPPLFGYDDFAHLGVWGAFHTFEPPTFDILGSAATSTTYNIFLLLGYLGEPVSLLDQFVQTNY